MKKWFLFAGIVLISCCTAKKTVDKKNNSKLADTSINANIHKCYYESDSSLPACLKKLIREFTEEEKQNPPRSIYSYTYQGKQVYFVPAICCDFFSDLYDDKCNLIAHPDGGYTGRGDGKASDFIETKSNGKLIWKDGRN